VIENLAMQSDIGPVLRLNTGYIFRPGDEADRRRAALMFAAYGLMRLDCIAISEQEFTFGIDFLRDLAMKSPVPLVNANIRIAASGAAFFMPFLRLERGGRKVLVTAVVNPASAKQLPAIGLEVDDPVAALRRVRDAISHDVMIAVLQTDRATAARWLRELGGGIDLAVVGHEPGMQRRVETLAGAQIVYACDRGKMVSAVEVPLDPPADWQPAAPEHFVLRAADFAEDQTVAGMITDFEAWLYEYNAKRYQQVPAARTSSPGAGGAEPLGAAGNAAPGTPGSPAAAGTSGAAGTPNLPEIFRQLVAKSRQNHFVGTERCGSCHTGRLEFWRRTRHAQAMSSLVKRKRENDPDCFRCHVTGLVGVGVLADDPAHNNPFARLLNRANRPEVQCEACHGPGSRHAENPEKGKMPLPTAADCRWCHTPDTDPEFDFARKKAAVCQEK
jgi:hypothetical protein